MTVFFTYYTRDTPYEEEVVQCIDTFKRVGIAIHAIPYDNANDWMTNALWRAPDLQRRAEDLPGENVCLLDADIRAIKHPELLVHWCNDFGCEDRGEDVRPSDRFSAGVLIFGPTPLGRALLRLWAGNCQTDNQPNTVLREQVYLHDAILELRRMNGLVPVNLGNHYNRKPEQMKVGDDTVLLHDVASRRWLKVIGGQR